MQTERISTQPAEEELAAVCDVKVAINKEKKQV